MSAERMQTDGAKAIQTGKLDVLYLLARTVLPFESTVYKSEAAGKRTSV
jgi:hypothetical protein